MRGAQIVTDMETAIVKAIRGNTTLKQIIFWRHLRQDVQKCLSANLPKVERSKYVNNLYDILRATTERQCVNMMKMEKQWDVSLFRFCITVPFLTTVPFCITVPFRFCNTVPFFHKEQKLNSVILYNCSVFSHGTTEQFRFCTTVPFLHFCSVFIPLSIFFLTRNNGTKTEQCGIVSLFRVFHMKLRNSFVFAPLFRFCFTLPFLYHCSVFALLFRFSIGLPQI